MIVRSGTLCGESGFRFSMDVTSRPVPLETNRKVGSGIERIEFFRRVAVRVETLCPDLSVVRLELLWAVSGGRVLSLL